MNFLSTCRVAFKALGKNKMRAGLTILGVVIGIAAVTAMVSIGQSASQIIEDEFQKLGTNMLLVFPGSTRQLGVRGGWGTLRTLTAQDCDAIIANCRTTGAASPIVLAGGQIVYGNANWSPNQLVGAGLDYPAVRNWRIRRGTYFTQREIATAAKVCVIGRTVAEKLFQTTSPLGQIIRIKNTPLEVIGVLEPKGVNLLGQDQDNILVAPYSTIRKRVQGSTFNNVDIIITSARSGNRMAEASEEIRQLLHERHHIGTGQPDDFEVQNTTEIIDVLRLITGTMTILLASIAGISLLVGGVGIMNIMLVSVTERTREIGIRLAVGARSSDILKQILVESVLLSAFGGVLGLVLGVGVSTGATMVINSMLHGSHWPITISVKAAVVALIFAAAVGVFFGYYPARRASRLDPIDSLRYE
jgi:putative ABC transport system permease protein